jgi:hypothetical protein
MLKLDKKNLSFKNFILQTQLNQVKILKIIKKLFYLMKKFLNLVKIIQQ